MVAAMRRALTLVEVLAALLVLSMGMLSAIAVARYGVNIAREAIAGNLAGPTAATVMCNARQDELGSAGVVDWVKSGSTWTGYVNGLFVRRTISDAVDPRDPAAPGKDLGLRFRTITVDVYWNAESEDFCRFRERMVFSDR
jgi:hypothetical protein